MLLLIRKIYSIWNARMLFLALVLHGTMCWGLTMRNDYAADIVPNADQYDVISEDYNNDLEADSLYNRADNDFKNKQPTHDIVEGRFGFMMPHVKPSHSELYLCTPIKVDFTTNYYIVGYEPNATMNTAHHMLLYGCGKPGSMKEVWNCGEMAKRSEEESAAPCDGGSHSQILYAWARDAPSLDLPEGVGFKVGHDSPIKYMVLQVHYAHVDRFKNGGSDDSGVYIKYTTKKLNKLAGVLLMGTAGEIPAMTTTHMETACEINENKELHPFAYRTHTHSLGKVVAGYKVRSDEHGADHWTLLGKRDPLTPQMFYPIMNNETIRNGDSIAARCTMESHRNRITEVGATAEDEMCNFYLMYYVENDEPLKMQYCFSNGPPRYSWKLPELGFNNIPEIEASALT